jgi:hypothetical protein
LRRSLFVSITARTTVFGSNSGSNDRTLFAREFFVSITARVAMTRRLKRGELYDLVWSQPLKTLATQFGISDVALAKACRRADIPVPERGYWAKVQAGKKMMRRPVCTENLNPDIVVMKPAKDRV